MPQSGQKKGSDLVKLAELEYLFGYRAKINSTRVIIKNLLA